MTRRFNGDTLVIATHNAGKLKEFRAMFGDRVPQLVSAGDLGLDAPPETGTTFIENALIKARSVAEATGHPALADDSGVCVDALGGAPGVYSADWAEAPGKPRDFGMAMARVNEELADNPDRKAHFRAVLVLAWPDGHYETAEGRVQGVIVWPPRGDQGFGYDPVFVPEGSDKTFAELPDNKKVFSHRARAFKALVDKCFT
jgi:XTP/dITP diphosphohydrolase